MMGAGAKILVVEDDGAERNGLVELLRLWGYEASAASDGLEALNKISSSALDLVISDLQMPRMSGFELLKALHERFPFLGCIIVSGADDPVVELGAMKLGAWSYIKKPLDLQQLKTAVRNYLDARRSEKSTGSVVHLTLVQSEKTGGARGI